METARANMSKMSSNAVRAVAGQAVAGQAVAGQAVAGQAVAGQAVAGQEAFLGAPRPHRAADTTVMQNSRNVITCTPVQYSQMSPIWYSSA
jgi:ribosomal protein L4